MVERLGGHPTGALGIELGIEMGADEGLGRWLAAACLLAASRREDAALDGFRALSRAGLATPAAIARAGSEAARRALEPAGVPRPERVAGLLARVGRALDEAYAGSLDGLARGADDLEDLAARLARLAPGLGGATRARFLRRLRDRWTLASQVPLTPAARAAGVHLGLLRPGEDEEGAPGALRAALSRAADPPPLYDVEAALERLGARACLRDRPDRCPLQADCPARAAPPRAERDPPR